MTNRGPGCRGGATASAGARASGPLAPWLARANTQPARREVGPSKAGQRPARQVCSSVSAAAHGGVPLFSGDGQLWTDGGAVRELGGDYQEALPEPGQQRGGQTVLCFAAGGGLMRAGLVQPQTEADLPHGVRALRLNAVRKLFRQSTEVGSGGVVPVEQPARFKARLGLGQHLLQFGRRARPLPDVRFDPPAAATIRPSSSG